MFSWLVKDSQITVGGLGEYILYCLVVQFCESLCK